jgi:hypothetical protein
MEKILNEMFEDGIFSNIFYVDENPAIIKVEKTIKEDGKLKTITESNIYNLLSLIVNNEGDIKHSLLNIFFTILNFQSTSKEIKYFNRGFIRNLFTKRNPDTILDEILNYNWIITTPDIIKEISTMEGYQRCDGNSLVKLRARFNYQLNDTLIFELPSNNFKNNVIYCGNFDSVTPVINRNKIIEKNKIKIEYIFQTKDNLKKLIIL